MILIKTDKNNLFCVKPLGYALSHKARVCEPIGSRLMPYALRLRPVPVRFTKNKGKTRKNRLDATSLLRTAVRE